MRARWTARLLVCVVVMVFIGSLALIRVRYEARKLQARLNEAEEMTQKLGEKKRRFQIELATLTDYTKVHVAAIADFGMVFPDPIAGTLLTLPGMAGARR